MCVCVSMRACMCVSFVCVGVRIIVKSIMVNRGVRISRLICRINIVRKNRVIRVIRVVIGVIRDIKIIEIIREFCVCRLSSVLMVLA